jgi:FdhD protein
VSHSSSRRPALRWRDGTGLSRRPDTLAVEEPLEIRVDGAAHSVTMRTPGHDLELALGYLVGEGVVRTPSEVAFAEHCPTAALDLDGNPTHNVVEVTLAERPRTVLTLRAAQAPQVPRAPRTLTSACGVCGTGSIDDVRVRSPYLISDDAVRVDAGVLASLPGRLRAAQRLFERTGGVHAAGLFTPAGELVCLREDVGRHNAVDKVVGWAFTAGRLPLSGLILQVSGRASFELAQKAWTAGCPVLAAVSAPSSLAVDVATEAGMTLVGFSRGTSFTIYAGERRVVDGDVPGPEDQESAGRP